MTHRNFQRSLFAPPRTQPPVCDDSTAFSLAALVEAEIGPEVSAPTPASSGLIDLGELRGLQTRPTHHLLASTRPASVAPRQPRGRARRVVRAGVFGALGSAALSLALLTAIDTRPEVAIEQPLSRTATLSLHHAEPAVTTARAILHDPPRMPRTVVRPEPSEAEAKVEAPTPPRAKATTPTRTTRATPARPPAPRATPTPAVKESRPETLTTAQIRPGLERVKADAERCTVTHGASSEGRVRVQLTIEGATGRITQATPLAPNTDALGRCVATQLSNATFPTFTNDTMRVAYTVHI